MQISKTKQIVLIAILLINYSTIKAQTKHSFTITQTVEYASKNNAQVKNALLGILAQEQVNREVTANAYPTIGADITVNNNIVVSTQVIPGDMFGQPGQLVPVKFGIKYNSNAMIQLRQLLFDGQVFVGLQARKASMEFAKKNAEVVVENIKVNIYKIYY